MKRLLLIATLGVCVCSALGQGALQWGNNLTGFRAPIYVVDPANPIALSGQSSLGIPTGSTVYGGPLLQGPGWTFAIYCGPVGAPSNSLVFLTSTTFRTATGNVLPAGLVTGGTVTVPGIMAGQQAKFQIRIWDNAGGTVQTWDQAVTSGRFCGTSALVNSGPLGGVDPNTGSPVSTPGTVGWTSFNIGVPEPSTLSLIALGSAAMLIVRRRK